MATVNYVIVAPGGSPSMSTTTHAWVGLNSTDTVGAALPISGLADRSIQISGTFSAATAIFQGSNDGVTWFTLTDFQGNAISKTSAALEGISEVAALVRPFISGADGSDDINFYLTSVGRYI